MHYTILAAVVHRPGSRGLQIIGVSMDDGGKAAVVPFAREIGISYKVLLGTPNVGDLQ